MPYVNGVWMDAPGAAVVVNDSNFQSATGGYGLNALAIGPSTDGEPNTPLSYSTPNAALAALKGGDGLQAVLNVFAGAAKVGGTINGVTFINVSPLTQGESQINSSSSTEQIALTTTSYGAPAQQAKWMVQSATNGYTVYQGQDFQGPGGQTYASANQTVSLPVISLYYTGAGTSPEVTITDTVFTVKATVGGTSTTLANITLNSTVTVQQLVNQLNQVSDLFAVVSDPNPSDPTGALFDNVTSVAVGTASGSATTFYANVTAVVRYFNSLNLYWTAERQANATSLATSTTWTYSTGATSPAATNSNWQDAYTTAQSITGIGLVGPATSAQTIWSYNDAHCQLMASLYQPRRGYVGDATGQSFATELAYPAQFNSNRTTIVWPEQQGIDYNGNPITMAPYLEAFCLMGERAATAPQDSLTQQPAVSNGIAPGVTVNSSMVSQGLTAGLCILAPNQQGTVVIQQDRTTWLQNTAYNMVENSTGICVDIVTADLQAVLTYFIGKPVSAKVVGLATTAVLSRLNYWYQQGLIVSAPQVTDISLQGSGDTITGSAQAAFAVPTNYVVLQLVPTAA